MEEHDLGIEFVVGWSGRLELYRLKTFEALEEIRKDTTAVEFLFAKCCEATSNAEIPIEFCSSPRGTIVRRIAAIIGWEVVGITVVGQICFGFVGPLSKAPERAVC